MPEEKEERKNSTQDLKNLRKRATDLENQDAERKKIEGELRTTELLYRKTIDSLGDIIHVVDKDLRIVLFNETFKQWSKKLGLETDVIGKKLFDIFRFLPKRVQDEYTQVFTTGEMLVTVETTRFGDRDITTETRKIPIIENDKVYRIITCIRDVTARKQALEALNKTEQEKTIILDSMTEHVAYCDTNMTILWANRSVAEALGESPEQLIGRHCYEIGYSRKSPCEGCPVTETLKTGQSRVGEMTTAAGRIWHVRGYPVRNSVGNIEGVVQVSSDITELKKTEEALRESQLRYKALFDRGLLCVYVHDFDGKFIDANDTALNLLGYAREEIPSLNLNSLLSEDQIPKAHETMKELKCYGQQSRLTEYRLKRKDGKHIWVETEATLLYRAGKPYAIQGIARDITERKKAMEALEENEEKYRTLVEQSLQGIVIVQDFRVIFANKAFADISGFTVEELLSFPPEKVRALVHPEDQALVWGRYMERLAGKATAPHYEYRAIRKDGTVCWLEMLANVITYQQKPAVQAIIRDITAKKEAEEALQKSEEKYRALTENINVGIYRNTIGPVGKFIEANPSIIKMFGYDRKEEFLSVSVADLYQHPEDRKKFNDKMLKYGFVKDEELQLKKKDGTPFFCSVSAVAVQDEHGHVQYYDGIIEDITERKRTHEQLHESLERLKKITENTLEAMAKILETRDPYTAGHQKRVAILVLAMADEMHLPENQKGALHIASLIHDIGKIYVPAEILSRPTKLTQSEFALIKTHPGLGSDILRKIEFPYPIADIILQHHERVNGSGYPQGLKGDEIMYEARILCVADVVEAMSSHRPYRPARGIYATLDEISKNKGILYDASVVDICLKLFYEKGFKFDEDQVV